jgi:hypothetical protein
VSFTTQQFAWVLLDAYAQQIENTKGYHKFIKNVKVSNQYMMARAQELYIEQICEDYGFTPNLVYLFIMNKIIGQ